MFNPSQNEIFALMIFSANHVESSFFAWARPEIMVENLENISQQFCRRAAPHSARV